MSELDRNLRAHAEARLARLIWRNEYARQSGGVLDFWEALNEPMRDMCRDGVEEILRAPRERAPSHD